MTWMDHALVLGFALVWPVWSYLGHEKFKARVRAGVPGERLAAYAEGMIAEWLFVAATIAIWIHLERDWKWLALTGLDSEAAWFALATAGLIGAILIGQSIAVKRKPELHARVRSAVDAFVEILPVHRNDFTGFVAMSITAGVCEEILYRGLLGWYFGHWLGLWGGQAAALVLFGAAHLYLGIGGSVRALLAGAVCAGLYLWSSSLTPSIVLHVVVDITSGWMAYEVLRAEP